MGGRVDFHVTSSGSGPTVRSRVLFVQQQTLALISRLHLLHDGDDAVTSASASVVGSYTAHAAPPPQYSADPPDLSLERGGLLRQ